MEESALCDCEGKSIFGYLTCCFRDNILIVEEFYLKSGENIKEIVKALFGLAGKMSLDESDLIKSIIFKVGPYQMDLSAELSSLCESYSVFGEQAYCILDFEHVVQTLLRKKHLLNPLQEGTLNLHIQEYGVLSIKWKKEKIFCQIKRISHFHSWRQPAYCFLSVEKNFRIRCPVVGFR